MVRPAFRGTVTASTIGEGNPSHLTRDTSWRHQGRPAGWPLDRATHDDPGDSQAHKGGSEARKASRQERIKLFSAARAEEPQPSVEDAGKRVGVARKTAYRYELARLEALADGAES